ncbi:MAG: cobalamin biosynthesis protein, partial [Betaproteobacteria bacterium]|nr:cobalamin biosynthesis protein [Betaproteobacteria bacterium]
LIDFLFNHWGLHILWIINLLVLLSVIQFRTVLKKLSEAGDSIHHKLKEKDETEEELDSPALFRAQSVASAIENAINDAQLHLFSILFWYGVLPGVNGVLLYVTALYINQYWGQDRQTDFGYFSRRMFYALNWPVYHLTALTFAVVGNFEDAIFCWRTQGIKEGESATSQIVFASAAGALGIRLGDPNSSQRVINGLDLGLGELPDFDHLKSTEGLIWRALMVWIIVYALMTLAAHV